MSNSKSKHESGQAIVLIVLAIVALIGFLALSVDVGQAYSNRRTAQNASDAAALAGAEKVSQSLKSVTNLDWSCSTETTKNSSWINAANAAIQRASDNAFVIDPATGVVTNLGSGRMSIRYGIDDQNGVEFICDPEPYIDVHVQLTSKVQTSFMHFVNSGELVNTVDTYVRVRPQVIYGNGAALLALKKTCDSTQKNGGIFFDGEGIVNINGGDIVSNACMDKNGTKGDVNVTGGDVTYRTGLEGQSDTIEPKPTKSDDIILVDAETLASKLSEGCKTLPNYSSPASIDVKGKATYGPGNYSKIKVGPSGKLTLKPGLYCIFGDPKGVDIQGTMSAVDVTFFVPKDGANFSIGAGATVTLIAPPTGCDYDTPGCKPAIGGLAILFMPDDVDNKEITITGNAGSTIRGTILAPYTRLNVGGNSDTESIDAQLIGETIKVHGSGIMNLNYKKDYDLRLPALMNLQQ